MTSEQQEAASLNQMLTASSPLPEHQKVIGEPIFEPAPASVKSLLPPGAFRTDDHRYYFNGKGPVPGATSVLDVLMKWDLVNWKQREAARAMWTALNPRTGVLPDIEVEEGTDAEELKRTEEALIKWSIAKADETRDRAAKIGSGVHLLADIESRDGLEASEKARKAGLVPDEWIPYLEAYRGFLGRYSASSIVSSEHMVWSDDGYGGTYDLLMKIPRLAEQHGKGHEIGPDLCTMCQASNELWLIDIKTSKGFYPEYGLQLAAYRWADAIILPGDPRPYPMPQIDRTGVLHLRPDLYTDTGWRLIEYPTTVEDDYMGFLGALEAYKWHQKKRFSKSVLKLNTVK